MNKKKSHHTLLRLLFLFLMPALCGVTEPSEFFYSRPTGYIGVSGIFGADRKSMPEARKLLLTLAHDSDLNVFVHLIRTKMVIPLASVVSEKDGLRFDLRNLTVVGKSHNYTYTGYSVTVQFSDSHVTCGPPTCLNGGTP